MSFCKYTEKWVVLFFILTIILVIPSLALAKTITVDDSGSADYTNIQDAITYSNPEDTIEVHDGTYYENVNVNKQLTLRGIGNPVVDASVTGSAITLAADGIILEGFTTIGAGSYFPWIPDAGILVISNNNLLIRNKAFKNMLGIHLSSSNNNTLTGNDASRNFDCCGIILTSSSNNTLIGNIASYNRGEGTAAGIFLSYSNNNILIDNDASNNNGIDPYGIKLWYSSNNTLVNNTANSNYNSQYDLGSGFNLGYSRNITLSGNTASNNKIGISLPLSGNNMINNNFFNNINSNVLFYASNS